MLQLNEQSGDITIDFPDVGPIVIRPIKFGAYRRIRAEQQRLADAAQTKIEALPELPPYPAPDETGPDVVAERQRLLPLYQKRLVEAQDLLSEAMIEIWRFILLGDDTFKGLANPRPPEDPDEWPVEMLVDRTMLDLVIGHMGKVRRSPSGPTP